MINDILAILKFIADPQTRQTIQSIGAVATRHDKDWSKSIKKMSGKFIADDPATVNVFANSFFSELEGTGLSQEKIGRCKTVFSELTKNAFEHGCQNKHGGTVRIECIYSRWFVEIEVGDDGKGFDLAQALQNPPRQVRRSGLQLVRDLSDRLSTNTKGNIVTALIASADRIVADRSIEFCGRTEVGIIELTEQSEWSFLNANWESLQKAMDHAKQNYILVTWKNGVRKDHWTTGKIRKFVEQVVTGCQLDKDRWYSFVMNEDWVFQDLRQQSSESIRFFDNEHDARVWILAEINKIVPGSSVHVKMCPVCQRFNRRGVGACNYCGGALSGRLCPRCSRQNRIGARFCQSCGNHL